MLSATWAGAGASSLAPFSSAGSCGMPIRAFLEGHQFEPETIRVMGLGFEMTMVALRLSDRDDVSKETVARKIIALAQAGERDPERLCESVLKEFHLSPPARPVGRGPDEISARDGRP